MYCSTTHTLGCFLDERGGGSPPRLRALLPRATSYLLTIAHPPGGPHTVSPGCVDWQLTTTALLTVPTLSPIPRNSPNAYNTPYTHPRQLCIPPTFHTRSLHSRSFRAAQKPQLPQRTPKKLRTGAFYSYPGAQQS